jgi:hypothetical protein
VPMLYWAALQFQLLGIAYHRSTGPYLQASLWTICVLKRMFTITWKDHLWVYIQSFITCMWSYCTFSYSDAWDDESQYLLTVFNKSSKVLYWKLDGCCVFQSLFHQKP